MRRRWPWWLLVVAFIAVPVLEIWVLIKVGQVIGAWWTIVLLLADGVFGSWLVRYEGGRVWRAIRTTLEAGQMPTRELADGMLVLIGGTLMISPGFVSDVFGLLCILPFTRPIGRRMLTGFLGRRLQFTDGRGQGPDVVQGEVVD